MDKKYIIKKCVYAKSISEALKREVKSEIMEIYAEEQVPVTNMGFN